MLKCQITGVYFSFCSATTVGFGDYYPTHYLSRILCLIFTLATLGVATNFVSLLSQKLNKSSEKIAESFIDYGSMPPQQSNAV